MDIVLGHRGPLSCAVPEALLPVGDLSTHLSVIILLVFQWPLQGPRQDQQKATSRSGLHHRERPLAAAGPVGAAGRTRRRPRVSRGTRRHRTHQGLTRDRHAVRCGPAEDLDQATAHWRALGGPTQSTEAPSKRPATVRRREPDQSRPVRDHHGTSRTPEAAPRSALRNSMGSEWPFWTLSGLVWVWSVSLSGHAGAMICPLGDQKGSSDAAWTGTWNTRRRRSWSERKSCRNMVEQLWLRLWRHRPARGPQGEQREKANWVVGPRMERKGKNSASFRVSRAVGVQKVRTREPLQEAAPGGRPGRLGDAVEAGAPVGSREASCFPGKLLF